MARTLPAGLAAKISAGGQQPELSVTVQDTWTRLNQLASGGTAGRSSAILSSTSKIIRAAVQHGTTTLVAQQITPTSASSWTATPATVATNAVERAGCCLVQTGGTTRLFYQSSTTNYIVYRDSTNDGISWGAETATNGALPLGMQYCYGIAADSTTQIFVGYGAYDPNGVDDTFRSSYSTSWSAWSQEGSASPAWGQLRGLSCVNVGGTRRFVLGAGMRGYVSGISAAWYTWNGTAYSVTSTIQQLDSSTSGLSCAYPDIFYDTSNLYADGKQWYAIVTLTDDGSVSTTAHTRTTVYRSSDGATWTPWISAGSALQYGAHLIVTGGVVYIFDAVNVYTIPAAPVPVDVTNDVTSLTITETYDEPADLTLVLANQSGQYNGAAWLIDNATITIQLGYGGQLVTTHTFYLDDWSLEASATELSLHLAGRSYLKLLDYPSTSLYAYTNKTVGSLIQSICTGARVTLAALPGTSQFSQTVPCFMITPGETWLSALKRLSALYGFVFRADTTPQVIVSEPQAGDPSTWTYGSEALATAFGQESNRPNIVRVTGAGSGTVFAEVTDNANLLQVGSERYMNVVDRMLDTSARCAIRANLELRAIQREATHGRLTVAINPQHELTDVITYTDAGIGVSHQNLRNKAISWTVEPATATWDQILDLEAP